MVVIAIATSSSAFAQTTESGSVGLTGTISAPAPTQGATISFPRSGQDFTELPITVTGICPSGLLVKLFKNNVFAGSAVCSNGSFSIQADLFSGQNDLVAKVFDDLDQPGPDSNTVTVTFTDTRTGTGSRVSLTTNYAKRGATPGSTLFWPITISGGTGPYALSIDWGDGTPADLQSQSFPGNVELKHVYESAGVYNIIVKVSDADGNVAYLQLVGVGNGPLSQTNADGSTSESSAALGTPQTKILWQPAAITIPFIISTFWLGKKYAISMLKRRIARGERPFAE
jgi:hypothetical protein